MAHQTRPLNGLVLFFPIISYVTLLTGQSYPFFFLFRINKTDNLLSTCYYCRYDFIRLDGFRLSFVLIRVFKQILITEQYSNLRYIFLSDFKIQF